jgi:hypothetical protein
MSTVMWLGRPGRARELCFTVGLVLAAGCGSSPDEEAANAGEPLAASVTTTTLTYKANDELFVELGTCNTTKTMVVKEPAGPGPFPVFIYAPGTWASNNSVYINDILNEAAAQGFVAASIDYQTGTIPNWCTQNGWYKARCAYSASYNPQSAVSVLCSRPKAGCSAEGIVVSGHSQGGAMAAFARNFDSRVRGAWTMGFADRNWDGTYAGCMDHGTGPLGTSSVRLLADNRLRAIRGGLEGIDYTWMNQTTGRSCPLGTFNCLTGANGSGWYFAQTSEVDFALDPDKHCFMQNVPLDGLGNKVDCNDTNHVTDPKFGAVAPAATYPSGMFQNIQWLKNTILPLGNQP